MAVGWTGQTFCPTRGERDELKYLSTKTPGIPPGKAPVGGMSELYSNRGERDAQEAN
jgi:hypothetical protein